MFIRYDVPEPARNEDIFLHGFILYLGGLSFRLLLPSGGNYRIDVVQRWLISRARMRSVLRIIFTFREREYTQGLA